MKKKMNKEPLCLSYFVKKELQASPIKLRTIIIPILFCSATSEIKYHERSRLLLSYFFRDVSPIIENEFLL